MSAVRITSDEFITLLEELLEKEPGSLNVSSRLADEGWDSLAVVGFMAAVDEKLGMELSPEAIRACTTVEDLRRLLGDQVV